MATTFWSIISTSRGQRRSRGGLGAGALLVLVASLAAGQQPNRDLTIEEMQTERRLALVIGNGEYQDAPLRNPPNDARAIAQALRECQFEVTELINGNGRQMVEAIQAFGKQLDRSDVGLFYFAGHGIQVKGTNYLVPVGANLQREADTEFECVDAARVLSYMEEAGNRVNIVILDACRNNPFARSFRSATRGLAQMDAARGSILAYATAPGAVAADGEAANGLYTSMLLKHIRTPAIPIEQVFKRVRQEVTQASNDKQVPWESSSLTGEFYFFLPSAPVPGPEPLLPPPAVPFGHLQVNVNVPKTQVYLNQAFRGEASPGQPLNLPNLSVGPVEVRAVAAGHQPRTVQAILKASEWTLVTMELEAVLPPPVPVAAPTPTAAAPPPAATGKEQMVYVPPGEFTMGSSQGQKDEGPAHQVYLKGFHLDPYEVTVKQYRACVQAGKCTEPNTAHNCNWARTDRDSHPINCVDWQQARAYCEWVQKRLPSEAEWEKAARGADTRGYPWGNEPVDCGHAVMDQSGSGSGCGEGRTWPVGSKPAGASPYKAMDMAGNVYEWVADWYEDTYYAHSPPQDPKGPANGSQRVLRGGSWRDDPVFLRTSFRYARDPASRSAVAGFRCARD